MYDQNFWEKFLINIKSKVDKEGFTLWLHYINPVSTTDSVFTIEVPNNFYKDWIKKKFLKVIEETASKVYGKELILNIKINPELNNKTEEPIIQPLLPQKPKTKKKPDPYSIKEKYTFKNFIIGPSNQFAHAASMAVAKLPSKSYNPLFIYGGVGLGKTHLLNSIVNHILHKNSNMKVSYVSSEYFVNDLINSIQHKKMTNFRNKYRNLDVLLVDDIQFISGKDRTQVEFFHTFNTLYESGKQIILSSDRVPKDLSDLEERLKSRFESGLIADIQPPDLETKVAILKQKASQDNFNLQSDVALFIAGKIKSNIRELEGCLARISAFYSLTKKEINLSLAKDMLKDLFDYREKPLDIKSIQESVADYFNLRIIDIKSKKRDRNIVVPRQIAMYLCRKNTNASLPEIGKEFGGRDHTTVLHSFSKIQNIIKKDTDNEIYKALISISKKLNCELIC